MEAGGQGGEGGQAGFIQYPDGTAANQRQLTLPGPGSGGGEDINNLRLLPPTSAPHWETGRHTGTANTLHQKCIIQDTHRKMKKGMFVEEGGEEERRDKESPSC